MMYPVIGEPPSCEGGCHDNLTACFCTALISGTPSGAPGRSEGIEKEVDKLKRSIYLLIKANCNA